jgi:hypothetical protein
MLKELMAIVNVDSELEDQLVFRYMHQEKF